MFLVLFDGECNFCDSTVQLIIKYDKKSIFKFASQQSDAAKKIISEFGLENNLLDTIILLKDDVVFTKSSAALEICKLMQGLPRVFLAFSIVPTKIRDYFYDLFARNRYRLFGKKNECMIPSPEIRNRFLQ